MKVLVLLSHLDLGGSMISAIELAGSLRAQFGWDVALYAPGGPARGIAEARGLRVIEAPPAGRAASPTRLVRLQRVLAAERPDLVHAWDWPELFRAYLAGHLAGRPVLGSCTAMSVPPLLPWALPITFVTEEIRAQDHRRGAAYLQDYPINVDLDDPALVDGAEFRCALGVGPDEVLLVIVSRLARWMKREGVARTIDAVEALAATRPLVLAVVGDGDARAELELHAAEVNRRLGRAAVRFTGAAADPRAAYAAADISLGMGTSIVRAMAFARPAIVLGEEGFSELCDDDSFELLAARGFYGLGGGVGPSADEVLRAQISALVDDPGLREKLGQRSQALVRERFDVHVIAAQLAERCRAVSGAPVDRSAPVLVRVALDACLVVFAEPVKRLVPESLKYKLQRRRAVRIDPRTGVPA